MPIYEYRCEACGTRFEKLVRSSSSKVEPVCPACGSRSVTKAFSTFGTAGFSTRRAALASSAVACGPVG